MHFAAKKNICPKKTIFYLFWVWIILLISFFSAKFYLEITNTLENNQNWKSSKMGLSKAVSGAVAFYITPAALFQNQLHLDEWLGHQEIFYKEAINPLEIDFDFNLHSGSYFSFIFNKNAGQFSGIRFSRNIFYPSSYFNATSERKFLKKENFIPDNLKQENRLKIIFGENQFSVYLNGKLTNTIHENLAPSFLIGFLGGAFPASVSNIQIQLKNSGEIISENFENKNGTVKPFLLLLSIIFFTSFFIYFIGSRFYF